MARKTAQTRDGIYQRKDRAGLWMSYKDANGRRRQKKVGAVNRTQAKSIRAATMARVEKMKVLGVTEAANESFDDLSSRYLKHQKPRVTPATYERIKGILEKHLKPYFKGKLGNTRKEMVQAYLTKRLAEAGAGTVLKEFNVLRHMFNLAIDWELIPSDPSARVEPPKAPPGRVRYLYPDEMTRVLNRCPEWLRPIAIFAVGTGMRRGEVLKLRRVDVDMRQGQHSLLPKTKNNEARVVHLNQIAVAALQMINLDELGTLDKVFPGITPNQVTVAFKRAAVAAGIEDFHFHDLRHTYASWIKMSGEDINTVARLLGHKDLRMAQRYSHLNATYLMQATAKLEGVFPALLAAGGGEKPKECYQGVTEEKLLESGLAVSD